MNTSARPDTCQVHDALGLVGDGCHDVIFKQHVSTAALCLQHANRQTAMLWTTAHAAGMLQLQSVM